MLKNDFKKVCQDIVLDVVKESFQCSSNKDLMYNLNNVVIPYLLNDVMFNFFTFNVELNTKVNLQHIKNNINHLKLLTCLMTTNLLEKEENYKEGVKLFGCASFNIILSILGMDDDDIMDGVFNIRLLQQNMWHYSMQYVFTYNEAIVYILNDKSIQNIQNSYIKQYIYKNYSDKVELSNYFLN